MNTPMMIIALGSNIGDRKENLNRAVSEISIHFEILKTSRVFLSRPVDIVEQPFFYNMVLLAKIPIMSPHECLNFLKEIEGKIGTPKLIRRGPRVIDLDILFYGLEKVTSPELTIPHTNFIKRPFTVYPLLEILPYNQFKAYLRHFKIEEELPSFDGLKPVGLL